jgi:hypothetical protein
MPKQIRGLYAQLVTAELETKLAKLDDRQVRSSDALRGAEAADRIALHVSQLVQRALEAVPDSEPGTCGA